MSPKLKQTVYSFGALFNLMSLGTSMGFPAILLPALLDPTSDIPTNQHQATWLVSTTGFAALVPVTLLGVLMHAYGRRTANLCLAVSITIGWIVTAFSFSLPVLFIGRFLHTFGSGSAYFVSTCVAEFTSPEIRGLLLSMKMLIISIGITLMHVCGYFLHWRQLALIGVVPPVLAMLITYFSPETPDWLVSKGRFDEAETIFYDIRGRTEKTEKEISKLIRDVKTTHVCTRIHTFTSFFKQLRSRALWRPVILLFCALLLPEAGGRLFFPTYSIQLAKELSGNKSDGFLYTFVIDIVSLFATILSCYLIKKFKRRHLLIYPTYLSLVALWAVSIVLFIRTKHYDSAAMAWISLGLLSIYFFIMTCTAFATSFVIMGELFPLEYRAPGSVINGLLFSVTYIATMKLTLIMKENINLYGMFLVNSLIILLTLFYFHYDLPETKDRTLQDIADYFKGKSSKYRSDDSIDSHNSAILNKLQE